SRASWSTRTGTRAAAWTSTTTPSSLSPGRSELAAGERQELAQEQLGRGVHRRMLLPGQHHHPTGGERAMHEVDRRLEERRTRSAEQQQGGRLESRKARGIEAIGL